MHAHVFERDSIASYTTAHSRHSMQTALIIENETSVCYCKPHFTIYIMITNITHIQNQWIISITQSPMSTEKKLFKLRACLIGISEMGPPQTSRIIMDTAKYHSSDSCIYTRNNSWPRGLSDNSTVRDNEESSPTIICSLYGASSV